MQNYNTPGGNKRTKIREGCEYSPAADSARPFYGAGNPHARAPLIYSKCFYFNYLTIKKKRSGGRIGAKSHAQKSPSRAQLGLRLQAVQKVIYDAPTAPWAT